MPFTSSFTPLRSSSCRANCNEGQSAPACRARLGFAIRVCSLYRSRTAPVRRASQSVFSFVRTGNHPFRGAQYNDVTHIIRHRRAVGPALAAARPRPSGTLPYRCRVRLPEASANSGAFVTTAIRPTISRSAPRENAAWNLLFELLPNGPDGSAPNRSFHPDKAVINSSLEPTSHFLR